jgi:hypothetical protein
MREIEASESQENDENLMHGKRQRKAPQRLDDDDEHIEESRTVCDTDSYVGNRYS